MSAVDSYYAVLDLLTLSMGVDHIDNSHPIAKHLGTLLILANQSEHWGEEE